MIVKLGTISLVLHFIIFVNIGVGQMIEAVISIFHSGHFAKLTEWL